MTLEMMYPPEIRTWPFLLYYKTTEKRLGESPARAFRAKKNPARVEKKKTRAGKV